MNASKTKSRTFLGTPQLPARYASLVTPLLLSIFMSCVVSMISTFRGIGADPHFIAIWLGAWLISWIIAFPTLLLVLPIVRKTTAALVDTN